MLSSLIGVLLVPGWSVPCRASDPDLVYESSWCRYDMKLDEKRLVWFGKMQVKDRYVVKTTAGLDATRFYLGKNTLIDIGNVKVRIERDGKRRDVELMVNEISPWSGYPEFSDDIVRGYAIPDLRVGDRVELEYEQRYKGIWEIPRYTFGGLEPKAEETLEIRVPLNLVLAVHTTEGLLGGPEVVHSHRIEGDSQILRWEARDWSGLSGPEPNAPNLTDLMPAVFVAACSLRTGSGQAIPVRATWVDFARWYESRVQPQFELDRDLRTFLEIARRDAHNDEELMERVYGMVQHRVRYLAYKIGEGGWIPHRAASTYANQYGDCKDMSTLIVALLRGAGIPAHLALVQSRAETAEVHTDFPYSLQFDHCVAYVKTEDGDLWMDATGPTPFGDVSSFISAHPALVLDGEETRFLFPTHPDQSEGEIRERFVLDGLHHDEGHLRFHFDFLGPMGPDYRQRVSQAKPSELVDMAEAMLRASFSSVSQVRIDAGSGARGNTLEGDCLVPIPGRMRDRGETRAGGASSESWLVRTGITTIRLPLPSFARKLPYRFDTMRAHSSETIVELPWTARADSLAVEIEEPFASFRVEICASGHRLVSRRRLHWTQEIIAVEQLPEFQEFLRNVRQANDRIWEVRR